ncbi:hypothetical protein THAOC_09013, partial [Thalassiosira oceanica]
GRAEDEVRSEDATGVSRRPAGGEVRAAVALRVPRRGRGEAGEAGVAPEGLQEELRVVEPDGVDDVREGSAASPRGAVGGPEEGAGVDMVPPGCLDGPSPPFSGPWGPSPLAGWPVFSVCPVGAEKTDLGLLSIGEINLADNYSSPSPSDPTATSARSSATSFLAEGPASPCPPRSRTDRKPTSHTSAPPPTPPPSTGSSGSGAESEDGEEQSWVGEDRSSDEEEGQECEAKKVEVEVEAEDNDGDSQLNDDRQKSKLVAEKPSGTSSIGGDGGGSAHPVADSHVGDFHPGPRSYDARLAHKLRRDGPRAISSLTASFGDFYSGPGSNEAHSPPAASSTGDNPTSTTELSPPTQLGQKIQEDSGEVPAARADDPKRSIDQNNLGTQARMSSDDDNAESGTAEAHQNPRTASEATAVSRVSDLLPGMAAGLRGARVSFGSRINGLQRSTIGLFLRSGTEGSGEGSGVRRSRGPRVGGRMLRSAFSIHQLLHGRTNNGSLVYDPANPVEATLVLEASVSAAEPMEVYEAKEVSFLEMGYTMCRLSMVCIVLLLAALMTTAILLLTGNNETTLAPTLQPTLSPTIDSRPTLEVIQTRPISSRRLRCGNGRYGATRTFEMCSALAAVVLGDPEAFQHVEFDSKTRWTELDSRRIDLIDDAVHRIEFIGLNETLVQCAQRRLRFGDCNSMYICVGSMTVHHGYVAVTFPSDFYVAVDYVEIGNYLLNGTCNVMTYELTPATVMDLEEKSGQVAYFGVSQLDKFEAPHSIVTRNEMDNDREFGDIATWTIMALIYGEAHNITKDPSKCQPYEELPTNPADLDYMKAVHCVGNYREIMSERLEQTRLKNDERFDDWLRAGDEAVNNLNEGEAMIRETPLVDLEQPPSYGRAVGTLARIRDTELKCGVFVPDNFNSTLEESRGLVGLNVEFCMAVSAAAQNGDRHRCVLTPLLYSNKADAYRALNNGTVDVIAGALWEFKYDFRSSDDLGGVHFSTPYFYGNESNTEDLSAYTLATMDEMVMFSSFVNCVVVAVMEARRRQITEEFYLDMPLSAIFGSDLSWALRDAVKTSGNYGTMMKRNFPEYQLTGDDRDSTRNVLNTGQPMMHVYPGLIGHNIDRSSYCPGGESFAGKRPADQLQSQSLQVSVDERDHLIIAESNNNEGPPSGLL